MELSELYNFRLTCNGKTTTYDSRSRVVFNALRLYERGHKEFKFEHRPDGQWIPDSYALATFTEKSKGVTVKQKVTKATSAPPSPLSHLRDITRLLAPRAHKLTVQEKQALRESIASVNKLLQ